MIPIIFDNPILTGNGYGRMADAISCTVTHEINGQYELAMEYPVTGLHYDRLENGMVLFAAPDPVTAEQPFRIYRVTRPLNGVVTVYARHIAYDMSGISVLPFTASSLSEAFSLLPNQCVPSCPFTFTTTRSVASRIRTVTPMPLWSLLGGVAGSFLDVYGGEWDFNGLTASLPSSLGQDNGVSVRYGKNMTELEQDITVESTWAAVLPFWYNEETGQLVKTEQPVPVQGAFGSRVLTLDFSEEWEEAPTVAQLTARTEQYITANKIGDPQVAWKVNMAMLDQSDEYKGLAILERVQLGDTVTVVYDPYDIDIKARAVMIEYDVLAERYKSINLGRVKQNLAKIVASTPAEITAAVNAAKSALEKAIDSSTDFITHGAGYMRFIYNDDKVLQEIVSLDNPDINQAQSVWRWNNGGFGHSSTGYAGPYTVAMTQDGAIVADFITAGTMSADRIAAGTITISKMDQEAQAEIAKGQEALDAADDAQATADGAATAAGNAQATANGAATAAAAAQTKADAALVQSVSVYYRSTTNSTPTKPSTAVTSTSVDTDNTWTLSMPRPKKGTYYYTCEQNTDGLGNVTWTTVRQMANTTYVAGWAMANNATYIDGASIYTGSITADQIATGTITISNLDQDAKSEIEKGQEALTAAGNAQATADGAATAASTAQTTANNAASAASTAQTTANNAASAASTAQTTANNAATAASTAQSTADAALGTTKSTQQYYLSTSSTSATGGTWKDTVPTWSSGKYVWTRIKTDATTKSGTALSPVYSTAVYDANLTTALSTASSASSAASAAQSTADGAVKSSSVKTQYYLSTSASSATGGSWSDTIPTWADGKYLWTRIATTTTPVSGTASTTYQPSANGAYDKNLTSALSTATAAASTAAAAQTKANAALVTSVSVYFRASTSTVPGKPTAEVTSTAVDTSDAWTLCMPRPKKGTTYYTCEQNKDGNGTVSWTAVRQMANTTYVASWASSANATYIDGANIYTGTVTADKIAANEVFTQQLTATNFTITGGSIQIETGEESWDTIKLLSSDISIEMSPSGIQLLNEYHNSKPILLRTRCTGGPQGPRAGRIEMNSLFSDGSLAIRATYGAEGLFYTDPSGRAAGSIGANWYGSDNQYIYSQMRLGNSYTLKWAEVDCDGINFVDRSTPTSPVVLAKFSPTEIYLSQSGNTIRMTPSGSFLWSRNSNYSALIWPDSNGAGRFILGDGTSTKWRTELTNDGLVFRNTSDKVTAKYPSSPTSTNYTPSNTTLTFHSDSAIKVRKLGSAGVYSILMQLKNPGDFATGTYYDILTLPEGHRPWYVVSHIACNGAGSPVYIRVNTDGVVSIYRYAGSAWTNSWMRVEIPVIFANP